MPAQSLYVRPVHSGIWAASRAQAESQKRALSDVVAEALYEWCVRQGAAGLPDVFRSESSDFTEHLVRDPAGLKRLVDE